MFWPAVIGSAFLGLIAGILISHIGDIGPGWFKPQVLGPMAGACMAALIGLSGAAWVQWENRRERQRRRLREIVSLLKFADALLAPIGGYKFAVGTQRRHWRDCPPDFERLTDLTREIGAFDPILAGSVMYAANGVRWSQRETDRAKALDLVEGADEFKEEAQKRIREHLKLLVKHPLLTSAR